MTPPRQYSYDRSVKSDVSDELINVYMIRPLAGLLVRLLYNTSITPNQLTVSAIMAGCIASVLYLVSSPMAVILAGLFLTMKDVLDSADGQLARAKQMNSRAGRFLDSIGDFSVNVMVFGAIGYTLTRASGNIGAAILALLGLVGITLRVTYHVYYQTSFLHLQQLYTTNRITEDIRIQDLHNDSSTRALQKVFQAIYGWQDRMVLRIDGWCRANTTISETDWFADRIGLRLSGLIGLGTDLFLLTVCSLTNQLTLYLYSNIFIMNGIALASIWYRRTMLKRGLSEQQS